MTARALSPATEPPDALPFERALSSWRVMLLWIVFYCLFHAVLRMLVSPVIGVDDVEQVIAAQTLSMGYRPPQPPLYTWTLWWLSGPFGAGMPALMVLKYGLLAITLTAYYGAARDLLARPANAGLALIGLGFAVLIGWEVHRAYTHVMLLLAASAATLWIAAALGRRRRLWLYAALGLVIAAGLMSDASYALIPLTLFAAMAVNRAWRPALLDWRMAIALALPAVLVWPYAAWAIEHEGGLLVGLAGWLGRAAEGDGIAILGGFLEAVGVYLLPLLAVSALCFPRLATPGAWRAAWASPPARLLLVQAAAGLAGIFVLLLALGVADLHPRRLHAALLFAPLAVFAVLEAADRAGLAPIGRWRWQGARGFLALFGLSWIAVVSALMVEALREPPGCGPCRLQQPLVQLADSLAQEGLTGGTVIAGDAFIGGNLAAAMPAMRVYAAPYPELAPPPVDRPPLRCVIVWRHDMAEGRTQALLRMTERVRGLPMPTDISPRSFNLRILELEDHRERYNYLVLPSAGDCV